MNMTSVFNHQQAIPQQYTCMGPNISPPLQFHNIPPATRSLVLIFEDVDATPKPWTHWMVFNIPTATTELEVLENTIPPGGIEGLANNHSFGYEGPCPKYFTGTHHYWFRLYALDILLDLPPKSEREAVEAAMQGHVLEMAALQGLCTAAEEGVRTVQ
jgi:Raf kinase inhibitor-like YbhB/YbcL family protein